MEYNVLSVSDLNFYIKNLLESDIILHDIWVTGELSNVKIYSKGGQLYFTLIDSGSQLNGVIYDSFWMQLPFRPADGLKVLARGKIKLFHKKGYYVFQCAYMALQGAGNQSLGLEQLKQKLLAEGLFDPARKKPIPNYPETVGLITAPDSAAMWDYVTISKQKTPHIKIIVIPAVMQGEQSPASIISALDQGEILGKCDILLLLRGGGSASDLAGFNHEQLVRRIAKCAIPIISAVGHEVNYTLTDFVADLRVPTPTAAAEHVAAPYLELTEYLIQIFKVLPSKMTQRIQTAKDQIKMTLEELRDITQEKLTLTHQKMDQFIIRLEQANPLHRLKQGYTITRSTATGKVLRSISKISTGDQIETTIKDGRVISHVVSIE